MEELKQAENIFKNIVQNQNKQIIERSQKVANEYIAQRQNAQQNSEIRDQRFLDLQRQIKILQDLKNSGTLVDQKTRTQIEGYLDQYITVRDELLRDNIYLQERLKKEKSEQNEVNYHRKNKPKLKATDQSDINEKSLQSMNQLIEQNESQHIFQSEDSSFLQKKQNSQINHRKCQKTAKYIVARSLESINFGLAMLLGGYLMFKLLF